MDGNWIEKQNLTDFFFIIIYIDELWNTATFYY